MSIVPLYKSWIFLTLFKRGGWGVKGILNNDMNNCKIGRNQCRKTMLMVLGAFDDNYVWCCSIMMFPPLLKPTPLSERGEENSRILVCCCTWLVFKMNLKASAAGAFYIELWNIYSWLSQFGCYWKSEALSSAEDGLQDLARAHLNNSDTNFDNRDKTLLTCLNLKSPCN